MIPEVDLVVLSRDDAPLHSSVERGIESQLGVRLRVHRVIGQPRSQDANRWETIARSRNSGTKLGRAAWLMFLDDDVVLDPQCVRQLLRVLCRRRSLGAVAAPYLGEGAKGEETAHVGMGATLFRRDVLERIQFRWQPGRCECQCCCDDLRKQCIGIAYCPTARAWHLKPALDHRPQLAATADSDQQVGQQLLGRVLAAFDRHHYDLFRHRFLKSLRIAGNCEQVTVIGYGLYPSQQRLLRSLDGVELLMRPANGIAAPIRRVRDFQDAVSRWPEDTPVAYWDAGDVIFQSSLEPLWEAARENREKLLAVREPKGHPHNAAVAGWTLSIDDPEARRYAFDLLSARPWLNSGFAAGTVRAFLRYVREADQSLHSAVLRGTSDWGDQTALNLYCHGHNDAWLEVDEGWNYCLHDREPGEVRVDPEGQLCSTKGTPIYVVHGNAHSLNRHHLLGGLSAGRY